MIILHNWRFETDVPLLMSPLHTYSMKLKKEKHGRRLSAHTSTNSTTETTAITRRPPMPLPISFSNPTPKQHQPNHHNNPKER
jgi:hypothetical protein